MVAKTKATFSVVLEYMGFCEACDKAFFKAARTVLGGSGYSEWSGAGFSERDHGWDAKDKDEAYALANALRQTKSPCGKLKFKVKVTRHNHEA